MFRLFLAIICVTLLGSFPASAAAPTCNATAEGTMVYDDTRNVMVFCDGTQWVAMGGAFGGGSGSSVWADGGSGKIYYNGGNVGIGTNNPSYSLDVLASSPTGFRSLSNQALGAISGAGVTSGTTLMPTAPDQRLGFMFFQGAGPSGNPNTVGISGFSSGAWSSSNFGSYLAFYSTANGFTARQERLRINHDGNVGIATIAPDTKLHVVGSVKIGDGAELCNVAAHEGAMRYVAATDKFQMCRASATGWEDIGTGSGSGLWTDSGSGYLQYSAADTGVKLTKITGMAAPTVSAAAGTVPLSAISATGTASATTYLRGDGSWATVSGGSGITALTGEVTASGTGSVAATIAANAVTSAKIADGTITAADTAIIGTLTEGKWCTVSSGKIVCTSDAPGGGPTGCPVPGNTCADGTKYAGSYGGWFYFVTTADNSTGQNWTNAVNNCENLTANTRMDWVLPTLGVLEMLYSNKDVIGGFQNNYYWSASSYDFDFAWGIYFVYGNQYSGDKSSDSRVRCVRRS